MYSIHLNTGYHICLLIIKLIKLQVKTYTEYLNNISKSLIRKTLMLTHLF